VTPPGTTGATVPGSNTPIGALVSGLSGRNTFAATGRLFADGMGNFYAAPSAGSLIVNTLAGTYTVNADCTITATLGDPFVTGTTSGTPPVLIPGAATPFSGANAVTLEGVVVNAGNANEIDLVTTGANTGALVTLSKTAQFSSCSNASLSESYGISGQGLFSASAGTGVGVTTGTPTLTGAFTSGVSGPLGTPFNLLGRFVADGAGNFVTDFPSTTSTVKRAIAGTYLVNGDCTGTARLVDSTGVGRNIAFVLVNEAAACSAASAVATSARQALNFVFTDPGVIGSGTAKKQ